MMAVIEVLEECNCADGDGFRLHHGSWVGSSHIRKSPERLTGEHRRPRSTMSAASGKKRAGDDPRVKEQQAGTSHRSTGRYLAIRTAFSLFRASENTAWTPKAAASPLGRAGEPRQRRGRRTSLRVNRDTESVLAIIIILIYIISIHDAFSVTINKFCLSMHSRQPLAIK